MPYFNASFSAEFLYDGSLQGHGDLVMSDKIHDPASRLSLWIKAPTRSLAETFCYLVASGQDVSCTEMNDSLPAFHGDELSHGVDIVLDYDGMPEKHRDDPTITALCEHLPPHTAHAVFAGEFLTMMSAAGYSAAQSNAALALLDGRTAPRQTAAGQTEESQAWGPLRLLQEALNEALWLSGVELLPEYDFAYLNTGGRHELALCWYRDELFFSNPEAMLDMVMNWHSDVMGLEDDNSLLAQVLKKRRPSLRGKLSPVAVEQNAWKAYQADKADELAQALALAVEQQKVA